MASLDQNCITVAILLHVTIYLITVNLFVWRVLLPSTSVSDDIWESRERSVLEPRLFELYESPESDDRQTDLTWQTWQTLTDRQTESIRQLPLTDRQTDRQTGRQTDRQCISDLKVWMTQRHTDRQTKWWGDRTPTSLPQEIYRSSISTDFPWNWQYHCSFFFLCPQSWSYSRSNPFFSATHLKCFAEVLTWNFGRLALSVTSCLLKLLQL